VIVLGYRFWQRYYGGDPAVVGRSIQLVRKTYQIVGVMPPRFRWREADIYVPLKVTLDPKIFYGALLKIRPGVSVAQANGNCSRFWSASPNNCRTGIRITSAWICGASSTCMPSRWRRNFTYCSAQWRRCC
jgi:hypothetical protein